MPEPRENARAALDAQIGFVEAIGRVDADFEKRAEDTAEAFYRANCVEEEAGKFRCPLSGKLFKEEKFEEN